MIANPRQFKVMHPPEALADRMPPQNAEAEAGVLGAALIDPAVLADVADLLDPDDFYRDEHATIYRAMLAMVDEGRPVDLVTVAEELARLDRLDDVGGLVGLAAILDRTPHAANALYHARIVREKATGRRLIEACNQGLRDAYSGGLTADELTAKAEAAVYAIAEREAGGRKRAAPVSERVPEIRARIAAREQGVVPGVPTGLDPLDEMLGGFVRGRVYVLGARPSVGKTSLCLNFAERAACDLGMPVLLFSLEMGGTDLAERMLCARSGVDSYRVRNPRLLTRDDRAALDRAAAEIHGAPMLIDDTACQAPTRLASAARREVHRSGVELIVLDYLQLLDDEPDSRGLSANERTSKASRRLKMLAQELDRPVIVLSQLSRKCEERTDKAPMLSDLRDSGSIEQDADVVMFLHRPEMYDAADRPGYAELVVAKNRHGARGTVKLRFDGPTTKFHPWADPAEAPDFDRNAPTF